MKKVLATLFVLIGFQLLAGNYQLSYTWQYNGKKFNLTHEFDLNTYQHYKNLSKSLPYNEYAEEDSIYPYLTDFALSLRNLGFQYGYQGKQLIEFISSFVQYIEYSPDPASIPYDYKKYPIETLVEKKGDCEDSSALLAALLKTLGFDCVMLNPARHMAVGVAHPGLSGTYYLVNNEKYFYIETTMPNWAIGSVPSEYQTKSVSVLEVEQTAFLNPKDLQMDVIYALKDDETLPNFSSYTITTNQDDKYDNYYYDAKQAEIEQTKLVYYYQNSNYPVQYSNIITPTTWVPVTYVQPRVNVAVNVCSKYGPFQFQIIR